MNDGALNHSARQLHLALLSALLAAGCGGGGGGGGGGGPAPTPAFPLSPISPESAAKGMWSQVLQWPIIPIHAVLLPDGRVLNYGSNDLGEATGSFVYDIWAPSQEFGSGAAAHLMLDNKTFDPDSNDGSAIDIFCSAQLVLPQPDAGVLITGGDTYPRPPRQPDDDPNDTTNNNGNQYANRFSYADAADTLVQEPTSMNRGRWYGSMTTLLNGDIYVQGGTSKKTAGNGATLSGVVRPEIRSVIDESFRELQGITTGDDPANDPEGNGANSIRYYYPRNFLTTGGSGPTGERLFGFDTNGKMYFVDPYAPGPSGQGTLVRTQGTSPTGVGFTPEYIGDYATAAMYRPGKILQAGGNSSQTLLLDLDAAAPPVLTRSGDFSISRKYATATILPGGQVLLTGGSAVQNELDNASFAAEHWDPRTGQWTLWAETRSEKVRLYHSIALLMPDGTVLVGGGGQPGPQDNRNAEIYYPPYLFAAATPPARPTLAQRPRITALSADPQVGREFTLDFADAPGGIERVTLIKSGSVTHNMNFEQRFIELTFTRTADPQRLAVRMPSRPIDAPPGYYLLFVLDAAGVPSVAKTVFVNVAEPIAGAPSITNPGDRTNNTGDAYDFTVGSSGSGLQFAAAGLPPGATIDPDSGRIRGSLPAEPGADGTYYAVVSVADGAGSTATANFTWTVN